MDRPSERSERSPAPRAALVREKDRWGGMSSSLLTTAHARLVTQPVPAQRYGLGVFLRKSYPGISTLVRKRRSDPRCSGATLEEGSWAQVPAGIVDVVQQRANEDTLVALHVVRSGVVHVLHIGGARSITLEGIVTPGAFTTLLVDVAPGAVLDLQERTESSAEDVSSYASVLVLLRVGAGAQIRWYGQSDGARGHTVFEKMVIVGHDAVFEHVSALLATDTLRDALHVVLAEPGAALRTRTLFAGASDHQFDLSVTAEHRAPRTVSDLRTRGVLDGKAQAVVRGLVRVARQARGADGYQRVDTLLLAPTAEVDPVPTLEINTNDVRCTHGVTTGQVDPEHLFYLQSRGYAPEAARALLVDGFMRDVIDRFPERERERVRGSVRRVVSSTP